jgi:hypothetical protein
MKTTAFLVGATLAGFAVVATAQVATGTSRPKQASALCMDGTFYTGSDQATACSGNGGVQEWWGKVVAPKDVPDAKTVPGADAREAYDKAQHPKPVSPPAGDGKH